MVEWPERNNRKLATSPESVKGKPNSKRMCGVSSPQRPSGHGDVGTAIRNLERAGIPRSAAMAMVGHKTESVYRRYAIVEEGMLNGAGMKLQTFYDNSTKAGPSSLLRFPRARARRGTKA